ncbi:hypothetical protein Daesc_003532 [Daldinia eschscholtzii]|uniref:CENP-V/GFA domain-containing protein n=1 Tax=Daldinia eschscholtzii TaxID=292717 RepID=A0AAX6MTN7_9PEZI
MPTGSCLCGEITVAYEGDPVSTVFQIPKTGFSVTKGEPKTWTKVSDHGNEITNHFCATCGVLMFKTSGAAVNRERIGLRAGVLDDQNLLDTPPSVEIYVERRPQWLKQVEGAMQLNSKFEVVSEVQQIETEPENAGQPARDEKLKFKRLKLVGESLLEMAPSSLPSLDELAEGMKGSGKTEKWDVVVSYSIAKLNAVLQKLWKSDSASKKVKFSKEREGPGHTKFWTDFNVTLATPTLSFTLTKNACLKMDLSGTYHDRTDSQTYKDEDIPSGYYFEATVPIICVSADGNKIGKSEEMDGVLAFDPNKANEHLHVVFSFDSTKDTTAVFDVKKKDGATDNDAFVHTSEYFENWIKSNWNTIQYSLAEVTPTQEDGTQVLTPEHVAFTVYPTRDRSSGCLSLYIKTKGSGNQDGEATTVFRLSSGESIPIPSDHTASIIIRRELVQKFLSQAINGATAYSEKALTVSPKSTTTGFAYTTKLNTTFRNSLSQHTALGDYIIREFDWSFDDSPLNLDISNNQARWTMNFENSFGWLITRTYVSHGDVKTDNKYGKVNYSLSMDNTSTFMSLDDKKVTAKIEIQKGWWNRKAEAVQPSLSEKLLGMQDYIPDVVRKWMDDWEFPGFSNTLRLDFFATTNVFAPGKHIIDIDTTVGVLTPYDLLIVGDVTDPSKLK